MRKSKTIDTVIFSMLGTILFISDIIMEFLPNIHPIAMLIAVYTLIYRIKVLIPLYVYVFILGVYSGFDLWWIPYVYIWTILWGLLMLIPKSLPVTAKGIFAGVACALHGILFGTLYAPSQAIMFGLNFQGMISWIVAGIPWDIIHMCGNIIMSFLIIPLYKVLSKLENKRTL